MPHHSTQGRPWRPPTRHAASPGARAVSAAVSFAAWAARSRQRLLAVALLAAIAVGLLASLAVLVLVPPAPVSQPQMRPSAQSDSLTPASPLQVLLEQKPKPLREEEQQQKQMKPQQQHHQMVQEEHPQAQQQQQQRQQQKEMKQGYDDELELDAAPDTDDAVVSLSPVNQASTATAQQAIVAGPPGSDDAPRQAADLAAAAANAAGRRLPARCLHVEGFHGCPYFEAASGDARRAHEARRDLFSTPRIAAFHRGPEWDARKALLAK
ncbi:hypothetical protein HK405_005051, partial [Cladochytrium tenue]